MSKRPKMLASVVRKVIAPVLLECPTECGMVSLTEVEVSTDFSYATVYVSALHKSEVALAFLEGKRGALQKQLGGMSRSRIPSLRFRLDLRAERGERVDELLQ